MKSVLFACWLMLVCGCSPSAEGPGVLPDADGGPGCSSDLQVDAENCGACGNSCGGGACLSGICGPATIAEIASDAIPTGLFVGDDAFYWGDANKAGKGHVWMCPSGGCADAKTLVTDRVSSPMRLSVADGYLHYVNPISGSADSYAPARVKLAPAGSTPDYLVAASVMGGRNTTGYAVVGSKFVFATVSISSKEGVIGECSIAGCPDNRTSVDLLEAKTPVPGELVATDTQVFAVMVGNGSIVAYDRKNAKKTVLFEGELSAGPLTHDDENLYWGTNLSESAGLTVKNYIAKGSKAGGTRVRLADTGPVTAILAYGDYVYFADLRGTVGRVAKAGGAPQVLMEGETGFDLSIKNDFLYWTSPSAGKIFRIRVPR